MKQLLQTGLLLLITWGGQAQSLPDFAAIPLESAADFTAKANEAALKAADYILVTSPSKKNPDRALAKTYLVKWFMGTPDFNFVLGDRIKNVAGKNDEVLLAYTAGVSKYALENRTAASDAQQIQIGGTLLMIQWIRNKKNQIKMTYGLKRLVNAQNKGMLKQYLAIQ